MRRNFRESIKALEADIQYANTLASGYRRPSDKACFQMRLSFSPAAHFCLFLVQWADCNLAGALGLLRILIYATFSDGKTTMFVHEKQASIKEFYSVIFPSLLQLQTGITEFEERKQKDLCSTRYTRDGPHERRELTKLEKELEVECGICMEINPKVVLPNCCHSLCSKCYQDWYARSQSCPFCRDALKHVKSGDLWIYIDKKDTVEPSVFMKENINRLFTYFDKLPLTDSHPSSVWHANTTQ